MTKGDRVNPLSVKAGEPMKILVLPQGEDTPAWPGR